MCEILNLPLGMLTKVNYVLKPEEQGWKWTGLYPRATHQETSSFKTKKILRESSVLA